MFYNLINFYNIFEICELISHSFEQQRSKDTIFRLYFISIVYNDMYMYFNQASKRYSSQMNNIHACTLLYFVLNSKSFTRPITRSHLLVMLYVILFSQVIFSFLLLLWMVISVKQRKTSTTTKESNNIGFANTEYLSCYL